MKIFKNATLILSVLFLSFNTIAQTKKDIVEVTSDSKSHSTFVVAIKAAGLETTLKGSNSFTVFAPTNNAFEKFPDGAVDNLLLPDNNSSLIEILTYHVVEGNLDEKTILSMIKKGRGKAVLKTVNGELLTAKVVRGKIVLTDKTGGKATVTTTNLKANNGVIHVVNKVLMPI